MDKRETLKITLGATLLVVGLLTATFLLLQQKDREKDEFLLKRHVCYSEPTKLVITWRSKKSYASIVELEGKRFQESKATRQHQVVVDGLTENKTYSYKIVFPNGSRSFKFKGRTKRIETTIGVCDVQEEGIFVRVSSKPVSEVLAKIAYDNGEEKECQTLVSEGGKTTFLLPKLPEKFSAVTLVHKGDDVATAQDLGAILFREVNSLTTRLAKFNEAETVAGLEKQMDSSSGKLLEQVSKINDNAENAKLVEFRDRTRGPAAGKWLAKRIAATGSLEDFQRAEQIAPLVLGTSMIDYELRKLFYQCLQKLSRCFMAAKFVGAKVPLEWSPFLGERRLTLNPSPELMETTVLLARQEKPMRLGQKTLFGRQVEGRKWSGDFELTDLEELQTAELMVSCNRVYRLALRTTVNEKEVFYALDPRPNSDSYLYQRIPKEALREGKNVITLEPDPLFGRLSRHFIEFKGIAIRLSYNDES